MKYIFTHVTMDAREFFLFCFVMGHKVLSGDLAVKSNRPSLRLLGSPTQLLFCQTQGCNSVIVFEHLMQQCRVVARNPSRKQFYVLDRNLRMSATIPNDLDVPNGRSGEPP